MSLPLMLPPTLAIQQTAAGALAVLVRASGRVSSPVGRLHGYARDADAGDLDIRRAAVVSSSRSGPIFGRSQIRVTSRRRGRRGADAPPGDRELSGRGALPFHVARREVRTDVAVGQRLEDGVDQRMRFISPSEWARKPCCAARGRRRSATWSPVPKAHAAASRCQALISPSWEDGDPRDKSSAGIGVGVVFSGRRCRQSHPLRQLHHLQEIAVAPRARRGGCASRMTSTNACAARAICNHAPVQWLRHGRRHRPA